MKKVLEEKQPEGPSDNATPASADYDFDFDEEE